MDPEFEEISTEQLVLDYQQGKVPFNPILSRFTGMIYRLSQNYVPGYSAEDLRQELAMYLYDAAIRFSPSREAKFSTLAYERLTTRIAWLRRRQSNQKRGRDIVLNSYESLLESGFDQPDLRDELSTVEILEGIELEHRERVIVSMVLEGHMNKDIAEMIGLTATRVTQILRGLQPKFYFLKG